MAKENQGLEAVDTAVEKRARRVFSQEEVSQIEAGVELLRSLGADENLVRLLSILAPKWHTDDAEALKLAKEEAIASFGGIETFKDWIEANLATALAPYAGISKLIPICNNISSFYGRRKGARKAKFTPVNIEGMAYNVNSEFLASLEGLSREEKRAQILAHPDTKTIATAVEL